MRQFHQEPILGHGWQGDILDPYIPLNIGSHSTIYGLLYTGGVVTLAAYVLAVLALGARLLRMARRKGRCQAALSIFIVVIIMSYGECIYSFGIPLFFAFGWMGSCLVADPVEEKGDAGAMRRLPQIAEAARA
jgi:O-antigen ligase